MAGSLWRMDRAFEKSRWLVLFHPDNATDDRTTLCGVSFQQSGGKFVGEGCCIGPFVVLSLLMGSRRSSLKITGSGWIRQHFAMSSTRSWRRFLRDAWSLTAILPGWQVLRVGLVWRGMPCGTLRQDCLAIGWCIIPADLFRAGGLSANGLKRKVCVFAATVVWI